MRNFTKKICEETRDRLLIIYGTGAVGEVVYHGLAGWGREADYFCDHDPEKKIFFDKKILTVEELRSFPEAVIILAFKDFMKTAVGILNCIGCFEYYSALELINIDAEKYELSQGAQEFLVRKQSYDQVVAHAEEPGWLSIQHIEFMITERCTLKCRDCSALVPHLSRPFDIDLEKAWAYFDKLLASIDYLMELSVLGGEPLLHPDLYRLIEHYAEEQKIGAIVIYTNGTVLPDEKLRMQLKKKKIWVHISDYGVYSKHIQELQEIFKKDKIRYFVRKYDSWQAAGDFIDRGYSEDELKRNYERCFKARCYSFFEKKLYCCARASNGAAEGLIPDCDFIDLAKKRSETDVRAEMETLMKKEYTEACRYCNGLINGRNNVEPAVQVVRRKFV